MKSPTIRRPTIRGGNSFTIDMNRVLFMLFLLVLAFVIYLTYVHFWSMEKLAHTSQPSGIDPSTFLIPRPTVGGLSTRFDVLRDPYIPPVKVDGYVFDRASSDVRGLPPLIAPIQTLPVSTTLVAPVNVETRGIPSQYSQVGILTKTSAGATTQFRKESCVDCGMGVNMDERKSSEETLIIPLFGRRHITGRDKWQYYAMSNTGFINTKLPIKVNGRSCTSEYGCDQIMNGDIVHVEGYEHNFRVTIYDNATFGYIPVI